MNIPNEAIDIMNIVLPITGTLVGIILGGIISYIAGIKTLKKQLKHDSIEKDKERKLSTKKEIYLETVDILSRTGSFIGSLVNANLKNTNISDGFKDLFSAFSKIILISDKGTVKVVTELSTEYQKLILKLTKKLGSLSSIRNSLDLEKDFYEKSQKELDRVLMLMKENNESVTGSSERINRLNRTFDFEYKNSQEYNDNIKKLNKQYQQEQLIFIKEILEETKRFSPLITIIFYNFRRELKIDTDIQSFNEILYQQEKIINEETQKFIDYLSELIKDSNKNN